MIRTQIQLTEEQSRALKMMALEQDVSVAQLIRRSIDRYLRSANQPTLDERRRRALDIIGIAASGETDLATNHDRYLAEAYGDFSE
jgi:hypothetical protein